VQLSALLTFLFSELRAASKDVWYFQAHELADKIHEVDLEALDSKTVS